MFQRAGVDHAAVAEGGGQNAVDVTFSEEGGAIFTTLTKEVAEGGEAARLVVSIGDEPQAAVAVMQALESDHVQIILSPDDDARDVVDLIRGG